MDIVRIKQDVVQEHQISENDIEVVKVGGYNLPAAVIQKKEYVVGRFATTDLKAGDYLLPSKLTNKSDNADCFPSHKTIARQCKRAVSTVKCALTSLEHRGYISKVPQKCLDGGNSSNRYKCLK